MSLLSSGTELKRFRRGLMPKIAVAILLFIPLIYGALYLWAFWAPTDHLDDLPVALVNEDESTNTSDGTLVAAGDDIVDRLLEGQDLDWHVVDASTADSGVSDGTYYFALTIPSGFSSAVASLESDQAQAGQLQVVYNDTNSFLASTLGKTAIDKVREAVAASITQTASQTVLEGTAELADGVRDAADAAETLDDGAAQVNDGTARLNDGATQLNDGATQVADGAGDLSNGATALNSGAKRLSSGASTLDSGIGQLSDGANQLSTSAGQLADGASSLSAGVSAANTGAQQLATGAGDLATGLSTASTGANQLRDGLSTLQEQTATLPDSATQLADGAASLSDFTALLASLPAGTTLGQLDAALAAQGTSRSAVADGASALSDGSAQLADQAPDLAAGIQRLATGSSDLADGVSDAAAGSTTLASGASTLASGLSDADQGASALSSGSRQLADGASTLAAGLQNARSGSQQLTSGASTLSSGTSTLATGAGTLASGTTSLLEGTGTLTSGASDLLDGTSALADGASQFSDQLADGADQAPELDADRIAQLSEIIATPVVLDTTVENEVQGFGEGFAPFFIALATFVGALITWLILRALPRRPLGSNASGLRSVFTGFVPAATIAIGQVVIMMLVLVYAIGLQPVHWIGTALFILLTTLAFLALQQMLIITLGTAAGRVVSLVLLMFQLSSSGGTYPVETTPRFFQIIHPYMPATYVVNGLRQLIGGGIDGRFWGALVYMVGLLVISMAISVVAAQRQKVWTISRLHPELAL